MAIPGSTGEVDYGIRLAWSPNLTDSGGNPVNPLTTIQRTSGTTAASTAGWTTITTTRVGTTRYDDILPSDGKRRWYRIRHTLSGYQASTWLGTVDAKPAQLP